MKRIIVLCIAFLLTSCSKDIRCVDDYCIDAHEYGIEGEIILESIHEDVVKIQTSISQEYNILLDTNIIVYNESLVLPEMETNIDCDGTTSLEYRFLQPQTSYSVVLLGKIWNGDQIKWVTIDHIEFVTSSFEPTIPEGNLDNLRIADTFLVINAFIESNHYALRTYTITLYKEDELISEQSFFKNHNYLMEHEQYDIVFDTLESMTEYRIVLSTTYEQTSDVQISIELDSITFTTK